ncbi:MAG: NADH oxidase [Hydrogenophilaceae bacterium]|nr:NADH oxidase [Hydrogenophilaceae bacterium]
MGDQAPLRGVQLLSKVGADQRLQVWLQDVDVSAPGPDQVVVRMEGAPIHPSDLGLLFGPADLTTLSSGGSRERPVISADIPSHRMAAVTLRLDQALPVGNEGAGVVVRAGANAHALLGKTVAVAGGAMYAQYRLIDASDCLVLPSGMSAAVGAACFVNPLTALSLVETMRMEGYKALVHTAAASTLGQMLNRICIADGVPLVNIVRSAEQAALLRSQGARYVVDSSTQDFMPALTQAIAETRALVAFDAVGGGRLASQILSAMEAALNRDAAAYSRYGSTTHKQVYIYGGLDPGPTLLDRSYGLYFGVDGFMLGAFLQKIGADRQRLQARIVRELETTFAIQYAGEISLAEALTPDVIAAYTRRATGAKYLINPSKGL